MRPAAPQLIKRQGLSRFVRKTGPGLRVGTQLGEALAPDHRQDIKHDRTVAR
jgi:hypothetical protein